MIAVKEDEGMRTVRTLEAMRLLKGVEIVAAQAPEFGVCAVQQGL